VNKDRHKLFQKLEAQGWTIEALKNNHYRVFPPDKTKPAVVIESTPSDRRAWANTIARLRRSGAQL
jgi:hypothetical protein